MSALSKVVPTSQIVFGTDFPYRTGFDHVKVLRDCGVFNEAELRMIERDTPLSLLPRLRFAARRQFYMPKLALLHSMESAMATTESAPPRANASTLTL